MVEWHNWWMSIEWYGRLGVFAVVALVGGAALYLFWLWQDTRRGR